MESIENNIVNSLQQSGSGSIPYDREAQINLVVNSTDDDENSIDLSRVFHNMGNHRRLYIWIIVLCMLIGAVAPLLMYQIQKKPLTIYSVVTLDYIVRGEDIDEPYAVTNLTAPDGTELDLSQITSSYVLQKALDRTDLSTPISLSNLRSNIGIRQVLDEESRRQQEILDVMIENKNASAYDQMADIKRDYTNSFIVSLSNGFGDEDARKKVELEDKELSILLDNILNAYNDYLVKTYADVNLPGDDISVIDIEELDIPEGVDQLRTALKNLYTYCEERPDEIKAYRSRESGNSLDDLMQNIQLIQTVDVEYLSSYVYSNGIARDRSAVIDNHRYNRLVAQAELSEINENIEAVTTLLEKYKNDEILISIPESDTTQTAVTNTEYYNSLLKKQSENYILAAEKQEEITEIESRIAALVSTGNKVTSSQMQEAEDELVRLFEKCCEINTQIRSHMEEIFQSSFYNSMSEHSNTLAKTESFLSATWKKLLIGIVGGAAIGLVIWGIAGLVPEFMKGHHYNESTENNEKDHKGKEEDKEPILKGNSAESEVIGE